MKKLPFAVILLSLALCGCADEQPQVVEDTNTEVDSTNVGVEDIETDTTVEESSTSTEMVEEKPKITNTNLTVEIDGIPFILGSTLKDVLTDLTSISYNLDANTENRNLSPESSLEIPIIGDGDRVVGYITVTNKEDSTVEIQNGAVTDITINPRQVLSVNAYGIEADSTIESTRGLLGDPDEETGTSMVYVTDYGNVTFIFKSSGELDGVNIKEVLK